MDFNRCLRESCDTYHQGVEAQTLDLTQNILLETLIGDNLALTKINLSNNAKLSKYSFTGNPELTTIRVHNNFTMDSCLFTSTGNNPSLSIFNTAGNVFYYVGQYSTAFGSAGVVFEITNGGQSGKMVSAEETKLAWSTEKITTEAKNKDDGMANMNTIKAHNHDLSKYPALKWCTDYGTDWYLPSINELRIIHGLSSSLNASINSNPIDGIYWSSSEDDSVDALALWFYPSHSYYDGTSKAVSKYDECPVRAVLAF